MNALEIISLILSGSGIGGIGTWQLRAYQERKRQVAEDAEREERIAELERLRRELLEEKKRSVPPDSLERAQRQARARADGYGPGNTGTWEKTQSIGDMRCNAHEAMLRNGQDTKDAANRATEAAERSIRAAESLQSAVAAAAASASVSSAASAKLEEAVRRENEETRKALEEVVAVIGDLREWKGGIEARTSSLEREKAALENRTAALERDWVLARRGSMARQ